MSENTEIKWSSDRYRNVNFLKDYVVEQIRVRYAMFDRPKNRKSNVVIDSFVPRLLVASELNDNRLKDIANLPKTSVAINPWFANMLNVKQIEIEQLCRILGYTKKDLKALFTKVKKMDWNITFIGAGGSVANTVIWLSEIAKMTNTINLFESIRIFEADGFDLSNLPRIPKDLNSVIAYNYHDNKITAIENELKYLSKNKVRENYEFFHKYSIKGNLKYFNECFSRNDYYSNEEGYITTITKNEYKRHVFYGAPILETRKMISREYGEFISATHGGNDFSLILNPNQDTGIQVESYGMIQLSQFYMNQIQMAISFLEYLATDPDLQEQNVVIKNYTFNGERKLPTDREYNFQMEHNGLMMDQEQAANIQEEE